MRQAGILAAAGIYALNHHVDRLAEDHRRAAALAAALSQMTRLGVSEAPETNMVMLKATPADFEALCQHMAAQDIILSSPRLVLHRDVDDADLAAIIDAFLAFDQAVADG